MSIVINDINIQDYTKTFFKDAYNFWSDEEIDNEENFEYNNIEIPFRQAMTAFVNLKNIQLDRIWELVSICTSNNLILTDFLAKCLNKNEHNGTGNQFANTFSIKGFANPNEPELSIIENITDAFVNSRFRRPPRIINDIAAWVTTYGFLEECVQKFNVQNIQALLGSGLTKPDVVSCYVLLPQNVLIPLSRHPEIAILVASELGKYLSCRNKEKIDKAQSHLNCAKWLASHVNTDLETLMEVVKNASDLFAEKDDFTIGQIKSSLTNLDAKDEIKAIEKAYKKPGFKFDKCVCKLKKCEVEDGQYKAYIMNAKDPRQVMLGYYTDCCQILGDAGETSMMHGLLHPYAGFWVIEEKKTGLIKAQAEAWEFNRNTLVFDNIEFANDTGDLIEHYKDIIGLWLENSEYENVVMGGGYNDLIYESNFDRAPDMVPPVTPYEIYVLSYEEDAELPSFSERTAPNKQETDKEKKLLCLKSEQKAEELLNEGRINYYDYLYSDTDDNKGLYWLKENGVIAEYFEVREIEREERYD